MAKDIVKKEKENTRKVFAGQMGTVVHGQMFALHDPIEMTEEEIALHRNAGVSLFDAVPEGV